MSGTLVPRVETDEDVLSQLVMTLEGNDQMGAVRMVQQLEGQPIDSKIQKLRQMHGYTGDPVILRAMQQLERMR